MRCNAEGLTINPSFFLVIRDEVHQGFIAKNAKQLMIELHMKSSGDGLVITSVRLPFLARGDLNDFL